MWLILWLLVILTRAESFLYFEQGAKANGNAIMHKSIDKPTNMYQKTFSGVLSDITLGMINNYFCSISLGTVDGEKIEKKCYDTTKISATFMNKNFNSAVPIELRGY